VNIIKGKGGDLAEKTFKKSFFEKKELNVWRNRGKVVTLHSQNGNNTVDVIKMAG